MDLEKAMGVVKELIVIEGEKILAQWDSATVVDIKDTECLDIATDVDRDVERSIVDMLHKEFPESGFQLEEGEDSNTNAEYQWVIDPIDGTKWYASGVPLFCVSIGLMKNNDPVLGAIYNPVSRQLYTGSIEAPAELNGRTITISSVDSLSRSMVSVDYTKMPNSWEADKIKTNDILAHLVSNAYRVRITGNGALSLAWIAQGSVLNAFVRPAGGMKMVDIEAGLAICKAAGATILTRENPINHKADYIVAREEVARELERVVFT